MTVGVDRSSTGNVAVVGLGSEHDVGTGQVVRRALSDVTSAALVVVELAKWAFLDSTIMGACVGAEKRIGSAGGRFIAINATGIAAKALRLTGLDGHLSMPPDLDPAFLGAYRELAVASPAQAH